MEQTRNEDDARREKTSDETPKKGGFKKQRQNFISKNWPQKFLNFFGKKNRYEDDEKKCEEEVWKEKWDHEQKRRIMR